MDNVMVSVYCLAYNHEKYIRSALEGFVSQKTNFKFEVIIHDDASTDNTADIIREYAEKYPDIIKPIFQKENQYSKGIAIAVTYIYPKCQGKYIAVCEGDDYWCDELKLQKQVDYMENNPDCTFCFSNGYINNLADGSMRDFLPHKTDFVDNTEFVKKNRRMDMGELMRLAFVPTATFMYRRDSLDKMPDCFRDRCPAGDLKARMFMTGLGYAYYISDKMAVYRENVPNSALHRWRKENKGDFNKVYEREKLIIRMLHNVNEFTQGKYKSEIQEYVDLHARAILYVTKDLSVFKDEDCLNAYKRMSIKKKIKFWVKFIVPRKLVNGIRRKV